eukprot:scaffold8828_cov204-Amphora_coffeaeformis.AAC.22
MKSGIGLLLPLLLTVTVSMVWSVIPMGALAFETTKTTKTTTNKKRTNPVSNKEPTSSASVVAAAAVAAVATTTTTTTMSPPLSPSFLSKWSRTARVFFLAGRVFLSYKTTRAKEQRLRRTLGLIASEDIQEQHPEVITKLWEETHTHNSQRILAQIEHLQGFWIKVGQYLSSRADIMPPQYLQTLSSLQDGVPSRPFTEIQHTLKSELSTEALNMLTEIDTTPLSTASLAQVHRATLQDGRQVVIKAQHKGVANLMRQDMDNLKIILRVLAWSDPDLNYNAIVEEYTKEVQKELDFRTEAENMQEIRDLLRQQNIRAVVPQAIPQLVTEKVLVMEYCPGFPIRNVQQLDAYQVDRHLLLARVCQSWGAQMHTAAVFNADPHAGNILVSTNQPDGDPSVPVLLDFGLTKRLGPNMKVAFSRLVHSSYENDIDGLLQSFDEMGLKLNRYDPFQDMQAMQSAFADPAPQSQASQEQKQKAAERKKREEEMRAEQGLERGQKLRNPVDAWPSELIFFTRVTAMLRGLCSRLDVRYPYLETMAKAASRTLRESIPEHERARGPIYNLSHGQQGIDANLQTKLAQLATELTDNGDVVGMQVCVVHRGWTIANIAAGTLGTGNSRPVTPSSLFNIFSVSKAVLTSGALRMVEESGLSLDDPIADHWPGFGQGNNWKQKITIRHALSHQSGLANCFPTKATIETLTDWEKMKEFIAGPEAVPEHEPGAETHYHYLTFAWLVGGLIEEIAGEPYDEFIERHLIEPLELKAELHLGGLPEEVAREDLAVLTARNLRKVPPPEAKQGAKTTRAGESPEQRSRLPKFQGQQQLMNPTVFNMRKVRQSKIPSANGHASAQALAKLMYAVASPNGKVLSAATLRQAIETHGSTGGTISAPMLDNAQASFGLGFQTHAVRRKTDGRIMRSIGHAGFGGSIVIAIPDLDLSVAFTTNQLEIKSTARARILRTILDEFGLEAPPTLVES